MSTLEGVATWHADKAMTLVQKYPFVSVLLALMVIDILTGIIAAFVTKKLCSTASYSGMLKKVLILALVATGMLVELIIPNVPWGTFVSVFFCVTEALSITENAANSGVPIPKQWADALRKARAEAETKSPLVNVVVNEHGEDFAKEIAKEVRPIVREGVHDVKDGLNTVSLKVDEVQAAVGAHDSQEAGK